MKNSVVRKKNRFDRSTEVESAYTLQYIEGIITRAIRLVRMRQYILATEHSQ